MKGAIKDLMLYFLWFIIVWISHYNVRDKYERGMYNQDDFHLMIPVR